MDPAEVEKAREAEMEFIRNMKVYEKVPRRWAHQAGKRVVGVRWIVINKGDYGNPIHRCTFVAKEFRK